MNRIVLAALAVLLVCAPVQAGGPRSKAVKSAFWTWFKHLKKGLTQSSNQSLYRKARVTAVAAVRGAEQASFDPDKPSWKGGRKSRKAKALRRERAEFESAVDFILAGKMDEGLEALRRFGKGNAKSTLIPEVRDAIAKITKLQETQRAAEKKSAEYDQLAP